MNINKKLNDNKIIGGSDILMDFNETDEPDIDDI